MQKATPLASKMAANTGSSSLSLCPAILSLASSTQTQCGRPASEVGTVTEHHVLVPLYFDVFSDVRMKFYLDCDGECSGEDQSHVGNV